jgi:hypothetical protein
MTTTFPPSNNCYILCCRREDFATEDQCPDNAAFAIKEATAEERGGFIDHDESALGDNSGGSLGEHAHYPLSLE